MGETIKLILDARREGRIVVNTIEGLMSSNLEEFLKQPIDGILYDLNRDEATTLTLAETDIKRVNDFAVSVVIRALKDKLGAAKAELEQVRRQLMLLTPGGSEFQTIQECIAYCDTRLRSVGKLAKERNQLREELSKYRWVPVAIAPVVDETYYVLQKYPDGWDYQIATYKNDKGRNFWFSEINACELKYVTHYRNLLPPPQDHP